MRNIINYVKNRFDIISWSELDLDSKNKCSASMMTKSQKCKKQNKNNNNKRNPTKNEKLSGRKPAVVLSVTDKIKL